MSAIFVTGTDTLVGKTLTSAGLLKAFSKKGPAHYWKPVRTGDDDEAGTVKELTELSSDHFLPTTYHFQRPMSAHLAARLENKDIDARALLEDFRRHRELPGRLIVEGIGGLLVPLSHGFVLADFIKQMELPVVIVAADRLGVINHTLLTLEVCRSRKIPVLGVILNRGPSGLGNAESIEEFGGTKVLARFSESASAKEAVDKIAAFDWLF